jgi:hypothetical protein
MMAVREPTPPRVSNVYYCSEIREQGHNRNKEQCDIPVPSVTPPRLRAAEGVNVWSLEFSASRPGPLNDLWKGGGQTAKSVGSNIRDQTLDATTPLPSQVD